VLFLVGVLNLGVSTSARAQAHDSASAEVAVVETAANVPSGTIDFLPASSIKPGTLPLPAAAHLPVPLNQRVLSYIDAPGTAARLHRRRMMARQQDLPMIQRVFASQGIPSDLAYVPLIESAFRPEAISGASAKGVWQFMKGTAVENGLRNDWYVDERSNPEKATLAAATYLKSLADTFNGDWALALASYNSGPGRVQQATQARGFGQLLVARRQADRASPRDARDVPRILAAIVIARNPAQVRLLVPGRGRA
jgi:membrane-bound lytic murein transglycosylase D